MMARLKIVLLNMGRGSGRGGWILMIKEEVTKGKKGRRVEEAEEAEGEKRRNMREAHESRKD